MSHSFQNMDPCRVGDKERKPVRDHTANWNRKYTRFIASELERLVASSHSLTAYRITSIVCFCLHSQRSPVGGELIKGSSSHYNQSRTTIAASICMANIRLRCVFCGVIRHRERSWIHQESKASSSEENVYSQEYGALLKALWCCLMCMAVKPWSINCNCDSLFLSQLLKPSKWLIFVFHG